MLYKNHYLDDIPSMGKKLFEVREDHRKQEFRRTDFGSRLLAAEGEGEGAVRVREERTGVGEG
jgi:hypothetical protein